MTKSNEITQLKLQLIEGGYFAQDAAVALAKLGYFDRDVVLTLCGMLIYPADHREYNSPYTPEELLSDVSVAEYVYPLLREGVSTARYAALALYHRHKWAAEDPAILFESLRFLNNGQFGDLVTFLRKRPLPLEALGDLVHELSRDAFPAGWEHSPTDIVAAFGGTLPATTISSIASLLDSDSELTRSRAVACLGRIGPQARDTIPALRAALQDEVSVCWDVPEALARILGSDAVPILAEILVDPFLRREGDELTRESAAKALARMSCESDAAIPALRIALEDPAPGVQVAARAALLENDPMQSDAPPGH